MALGPGKYDDECTQIREQTGAEVVLVVVLGGAKGHGFSMQSRGRPPIDVAELLRNVAKEIEAE